MKVKSTPYYIAQIIQNSVFWTRAMHELRYADSHIVVSRSRYTDMMSADLFDRCNEQWHNEMHITHKEYREFVRYLTSHTRKHGSECHHDINFAEGKNIGGRPFGTHNPPQAAIPVDEEEQEKKYEYSSLKDEKWGTPIKSARAPAGIHSQKSDAKENQKSENAQSDVQQDVQLTRAPFDFAAFERKLRGGKE